MTRREAILEGATKLFAEKGFRETSIAEIATLTNVAEGTIFYHFKTKPDLLLAILERMKEQILEEFQRYLKERKSRLGIDALEDTISFYLYLAAKLEDQFLLLHQNFLYQMAQTNTKCNNCLREIYNRLVDIFEQAVADGQHDGSIGDVPSRKTALLIFTLVDGLVRFKQYNLYDGTLLSGELLAACRRMLEKRPQN